MLFFPTERGMQVSTNDPLGRSIQTYRGTRDFFGDEARWRLWVIEQVRASFEAFGFEPLETPVIENDRTLQGKYGQEGESRRFRLKLIPPDEAGLRYDHTVPLARFMAMYWNRFPMPYRRYVIGPVFRHESPQAGRLRQFTQCDFDTVGSKSQVIDAEIVAMNYTVLTKLGFADKFSVRINSRELLNSMVAAMGFEGKEQTFAVFRGWDKLEKADRASVQQELEEVGVNKELISSFNDSTDELLSLCGQRADRVLSGLTKTFKSTEVKKAVEQMNELIGFVSAMGVPETCYELWPLLARGLDYYTGPIFETVVKEAGIGSVTGGGRFDKLIAQMGGPDIPASGSSFGLERVTGVMEQLGLKPKSSQTTQVFVTLFDLKDEDLCQASFRIAATLRTAGIDTEVYTGEADKIGKQLDIANRKGIPLVVILGPDEKSKEQVTLKDLRLQKGTPGGQMTIPVDKVVEQVNALLKR